MSPDEIIRAHPHISLAQVHEALAYFYKHIKEMREKIFHAYSCQEFRNVGLTDEEQLKYAHLKKVLPKPN